MRTLDLSTLFRSSVGFDHMTRMMDAAQRLDEGPSYPPYNIEKITDDDYSITMAVAGFAESDLELSVENQMLTVSGRIQKDESEQERAFLHKGIANRAFERRFQLADHVKVIRAGLENGLLQVDLQREVPEALKPRTIEIESSKATVKKAPKKPKLIDTQAA